MSDKPAPGKRVAVLAPVTDEKGGTKLQFGTIDEKHAAAIIKAGGRVLSKQEVAQHEVDARYDALPAAAKALGAVNTATGALNPLTLGANTGAPTDLQAYSGGVREGLTGGLADAGIRKVVDAAGGKAAGDKYAAQVEQERTAAPLASGIGEGVGLVAGSVLGEAGAARALPTSGGAALGSAAEKWVGGKAASLLGKGVGGRALTAAAEMGTRGAIEGGIYSGTKYAGEEWLQDKELAADKLFAAAGTGALYGLGGGALLGGAGSLAASGARSLGGGLARAMSKEGGAAVAATGGKSELRQAIDRGLTRDEALAEMASKAAGGGAEEAATAGGVYRTPGVAAAEAPAKSVLSELTSSEGQKGLAYDRAWGAMGGGFGLQSTDFAKRAQRYLPNGTRDVGEWVMRKGVIDAKAGVVDLAKNATPEKMLPAIRSAVEADGVRLGEITGASGGRVKSSSVMQAIDDVARKYDESAATRPIGRSIRNFGNELLDSLGVTKGVESHAVQDLLRERKALDMMVFENAALDPSVAIQVKRELRGKLEGLVIDSMDEASGKLSGELAKEYKALKKDYLAGMLAQEAAEDSAARAAKAGFMGLKDLTFGGGSILKSMGSKLVRERGDAVAAAMLFRESERGGLAALVQKMSGDVEKASKGLLQAPAKGLLKAADKMPSTKLLAHAAVTRVAEFNADPEAFVEKATRQAEHIAAHDPEIASGIVQRQVQGMSFLAEKMPVTPDPDPLDPHPAPKMTPNEAAEFGRYAWYVEKPQRFFTEVARGKLTYEGAETAQRLMPGAFEELQMRTMEALATQMSRGNKLPYRQRQILGVLMDVATTPSQRPDHAAFLQKNLEPIQDPAPKGGGGGGGKSLAGPKLGALDQLEAHGAGHKS